MKSGGIDVMLALKGKPKGKPKEPSYEDDAEGEADGEDMDGAELMKQMHESCKAGDYESAWESLQAAVILAQDSESEEEA